MRASLRGRQRELPIDREFVTSAKKKSRILTNFPKLKKFVKIRKKIVRCPSGSGLPTTTEEFDAFHGFMLIKI